MKNFYRASKLLNELDNRNIKYSFDIEGIVVEDIHVKVYDFMRYTSKGWELDWQHDPTIARVNTDRLINKFNLNLED